MPGNSTFVIGKSAVKGILVGPRNKMETREIKKIVELSAVDLIFQIFLYSENKSAEWGAKYFNRPFCLLWLNVSEESAKRRIIVRNESICSKCDQEYCMKSNENYIIIG